MFSNGDNLSLFEEDKFLTIRQGQIPLLAFDYLIDDDPELSEKENFARKEKAGSISNFGGRLYGKCENFYSKILLANGSRVKLGNLIGTQQNILALDERNFKLIKTTAKFYDNGEKECYKIKTDFGKENTVTENHPFLTRDGWKAIIEINNNDVILTLRTGTNKFYDVHWEQVIEVKRVGKKQTVAVSVPKYNNYISNDIISHNTFVGERLDFCQYPVVAENETAGFTAFDALHLKGVLDDMYTVWKNHPIISSFVDRVIRSPYVFKTKYGITIDGVNMKIGAGSEAGSQFFQKHYKRLIIEEASHENEIVYDKRTDSVSEFGCVIRQFGMTDFVKNSPPGKVFYDPKNKWKVLNLPQFINPYFDDRQNQERIKKFGGTESFGYRIFVKGEIVEDGESVFDMPLIRDLNYPHTKTGDLDEKRVIKHIELNKKRFNKYKNFVILSRPANADVIYVCFKEGTEILTKQGWKDFREVNYNDKVLTLDINTNQSFYKPIDNIVVQKHQGDLITHNSETLKFSVTPDHNMLVKRSLRKGKGKLEFIKANKLPRCYVKRDIGNLKQKYLNLKQIKLTAKNARTLLFKIEDFVEFLGWYISEGCTLENQNYRINISQSLSTNKKNCQQIKELLQRMGLNYYFKNVDFYIHSKALYFWLRQNCYLINQLSKKRKSTYYNCYNKKIPDFVRNLHPKLIKIFLDSYTKGDGYITEDNRWGMVTTSYKLANDVQELVLKTGKVATIEYKPEGEVYNKGRQSYHQKSYTVYVWRKNTDSKIRKRNLLKEKYNGNVYCVETNPYNTIYVKDKGKPFWCGNCADIGQQGGITEIIIIAQIKGKFRYLYNITLINMTKSQQDEIFNYVRELVNPNFVALDLTGGMGEAIFTDMQENPKYKNVKLIRCAFNENIPVGLELDEETDKPIRKNGKLVERMVNAVEQSVNRLCHLFYEAKIFLPYDSRLDEQLDKVVAIASKVTNKILYRCIAREDHLWQAFQVFSIAQWLVEYGNLSKPKGNQNAKHCKTGAI